MTDYSTLLSPEVKNSLDMKDKNQSKRVNKVVPRVEDSSKNIHIYKYYETYRRHYLHNAPFLNSEEVCELFDIKPNTLDHWVRKGWIGFSHQTNKRIFLRSDIDAFTKRRRNEADPE